MKKVRSLSESDHPERASKGRLVSFASINLVAEDEHVNEQAYDTINNRPTF